MKQKGFGLIVVVIALAVIGIGVAYYFGTQQKQIEIVTSPNIVTQTSTPSPWKEYTIPNNKYKISYPSPWQVVASSAELWKQEYGSPEVKLINGEYEIKLSFPSGYGPGICIFSDHPDFNKEFVDNPILSGSKCQGAFVTISRSNTESRRLEKPSVTSDGRNQWTVYTKDNSTYFTAVPPIDFYAPKEYDVNMILEMDRIVSTYKAIN